MTVTVQEIVNLPIFNTAEIRTGIEILNKREVEWVTAIEGPVENFVRKNEFILTKGMGCENNPEMFYQFVKEVYESGASALAVALGRYIYEIPPEVVSFAEKNEFVIIELPWELRFTDIQRQAMQLIYQRKEKFSEEAHQTQRKLIDFVVQGKDLSDIIQYVERKLTCQIVYADSKGRLKFASANPDALLKAWNDIEVSDEKPLIVSNARHIQQVTHNDSLLLKKEITTESRRLSIGHFIIYFPEKTFLNEHELQVLESLTATTALWISKEDAIVKTEIRLRNEFIFGLAKEPQEIDDTIISKAKLFGYNLEVPYTCIIGYSTSFDGFSPNEDDHEYLEYGFKSIIYYIEEEVKYAASIVNRLVLFTYDNDRLIIYLEHNQDESNNIVNHFIDLVEKRLNDTLPSIPFSWGIGKSKDGMMQFHESFNKALSALEMALKEDGTNNRVSFEDTRLNRLLLHLAKHDDIREITLKTIAPLIDYDNDREIELIDTFMAYQNQNGNVSQAARVLNLHRQSLLYRLKKIETLTNLSLDDPDDVFLLNISIKVWEKCMLKDELNDHEKSMQQEDENVRN